jgi:thioredoxin 1
MIYMYIGILVLVFGLIFVLNNSGKVNAVYNKKISELNHEETTQRS